MKTPFSTKFKKEREELSVSLYKEFNLEIFNNELPMDLLIEWSVNLHKTAGRTFLTKRITKQHEITETIHTARIELSTKVLDTICM